MKSSGGILISSVTVKKRFRIRILSDYSTNTHYLHDAGYTLRDQTFYIKRRHLTCYLLMPGAVGFDMKAKLSYHIPTRGDYNFEPAWGVCFVYDRFRRSGYQLVLKYRNKSSEVVITLFRKDGMNQSEVGSRTIHNVSIQPLDCVDFEMRFDAGCIKVGLIDNVVSFAIEPKYGLIAISGESRACEAFPTLSLTVTIPRSAGYGRVLSESREPTEEFLITI